MVFQMVTVTCHEQSFLVKLQPFRLFLLKRKNKTNVCPYFDFSERN